MENPEHLCQQAEKLLMQAKANDSDPELIHQALQMYQQVIQQEDEIPDPWLGIAYIMFSFGQKERAIDVLTRAYKKFPFENRLLLLKLRLEKAATKEQIKTAPAGSIQRIVSLKDQAKSKSTEDKNIEFDFEINFDI